MEEERKGFTKTGMEELLKTLDVVKKSRSFGCRDSVVGELLHVNQVVMRHGKAFKEEIRDKRFVQIGSQFWMLVGDSTIRCEGRTRRLMGNSLFCENNNVQDTVISVVVMD